MTLGSRIKEYRTKRGYTQAQMAHRLGMTEANFSSYERDKSTPPSERLNLIAGLLNVSTDYLLERTDDPSGFKLTRRQPLTPDDTAEGFSDEYADRYDEMLSELGSVIRLLSNRSGRESWFSDDIRECIEEQSEHIRSAYDVAFDITPDDILQVCKEVDSIDFLTDMLDMMNRVREIQLELGRQARARRLKYGAPIEPKITDIQSVGKRVALPVVGTVTAGLNGLAFQEYLGSETADVDDLTSGEYYWLKVKGDSMIGDGIFEGDLALFRIQPEVENGALAVVVVDGEFGCLKRVYHKDGGIVLQSSNPSYAPRIFMGDETSIVRIVGRVKEIKRKF